jgi:hypothetical protein
VKKKELQHAEGLIVKSRVIIHRSGDQSQGRFEWMLYFKYATILAIITCIAFVAYYPTLNGGYFADDYALQVSDKDLDISNLFTPANGYSCRPLEVLFLYTMQRCFGCDNTLPIHIVNLFIHYTFSIMIMVYMLKNGFSIVSSIIAFTCMILSQANSHAVASIDTFSQLTSTFLGYAVIILNYSFFKTKKHYLLIISVALYIAALYCKETALFVLPFIGLLHLDFWIKNVCKSWTITIRQILAIIPYIAVTGIYLWLRELIGLTGASAGDDRYNISIGFNVIKNFLMLLFQSLQPQSSVNLYFDIVNGQWNSIILVIITSGVVCSFAVWGNVKKGESENPAKLLLLFPASIFPVILLNHVSELYAYNMTPLCAMVIGSGFGKILVQSGKRILKSTCVLVLLCFILWNSVSIYTKCSLMKENGQQSKALLEKIQPYYRQIPYGGTLILLNPETTDKTEYSIFKVTGFKLFDYGTMVFNRMARRNDFTTVITSEKCISNIDVSKSVVLRYCGGEVVLKKL